MYEKLPLAANRCVAATACRMPHRYRILHTLERTNDEETFISMMALDFIFRCDFRFATTLPTTNEQLSNFIHIFCFALSHFEFSLVSFFCFFVGWNPTQNFQVASECVRFHNWHGKTEEPVYLLHTFSLKVNGKNINLDFCTHQICHHQHQTQSVYFPVRDIIVSSLIHLPATTIYCQSPSQHTEHTALHAATQTASSSPQLSVSSRIPCSVHTHNSQLPASFRHMKNLYNFESHVWNCRVSVWKCKMKI